MSSSNRDQRRNGKSSRYRGTERRDHGCLDRSNATAKTGKPRVPRNARWRDALNVQNTGKRPSLVRGFDFGYQQWVRDIQLGIQNLMLHGLRSLLTMLGMIFGVAAVVCYAVDRRRRQAESDGTD